MRERNVELPLLKGKPKEKYIPMSVVIGVIIFLALVLVASFAFTFKGTYKVHYSEKSNIDYKVYLKENSDYPEKYLGKNRRYIASLIKNIDKDFDYTFKIDEKIDLKYTYYVVAKLEINDSQGTNIFEKEELLTTKKSNTTDKDTFKVHEDVQIDYGKFNAIATEFIDKYKLTANSKLTVSLIVDVEGKHTDFDNQLSDKEVISLNIPLTEKTIDIEMDYNLTNSVDQTLQQRSTILNNRPLLFITIFISFVDLFAIIYVIYWVVVNRSPETLYNKKLDKILRDYNRYISETIITERVEDMMVTRSLWIEVIKKFEDLLDIRDSLNKPILYHEERPNQEAVFYILTDRIGYLYVMRAEDFIKKSKKNKKEEVVEEKKVIKKEELIAEPVIEVKKKRSRHQNKDRYRK